MRKIITKLLAVSTLLFMESLYAEGEIFKRSNGCSKNITRNINIQFIFDDSGSQIDTDPVFVRGQAAQRFLLDLHEQIHPYKKMRAYINIISFSDHASFVTANKNGNPTWIELSNTNKSLLMTKVMEATQTPAGSTNYVDAFKLARRAIWKSKRRGDKKDLVFFITDGMPTVPEFETKPNHYARIKLQAGYLKTPHSDLHIIGAGAEVAEDRSNFLFELASSVGGKAHISYDPEHIRKTLERVKENLIKCDGSGRLL